MKSGVTTMRTLRRASSSSGRRSSGMQQSASHAHGDFGRRNRRHLRDRPAPHLHLVVLAVGDVDAAALVEW